MPPPHAVPDKPPVDSDADPPGPTLARGARWLFVSVLAMSALYVMSLVDLGWVPHDEGTLAQPAERVLMDGELPHRDFDDMYTGGQALFHAGVFRVLGVSLLSLRMALFTAFLLVVPALWYIATRFAGRMVAALVVLLAVAWSVPNYPAAMPSWYNLFFAVWAVAAGLRFLETDRRRWLLVAGSCVGLSITVKIVGLYLLAALLLFAVYYEQECSRRIARGRAIRPPREIDLPPTAAKAHAIGRTHSVLVIAGLLLFAAAVLWLVRPLAGPATVFHFALPPTVLAGWLAVREWRTGRLASAVSGRPIRLAGLVGPILLGTAIPAALFLVPYVLTGSVGDLLNGTLVVPTRRFGFATRLPPGLMTALPLAAITGLGVWAANAGRGVDRVIALVLALPLAGILLLSGMPAIYRTGWWLMRPLVPLLVGTGVWVLATRSWEAESGGPAAAGRGLERGVSDGHGPRNPGSGDPGHPEGELRLSNGVVLLLVVTAMVSLVQFPTSGPVYFFYVAPLGALLALGVVRLAERPPWTVAGVLLAFHLVFAARWIHPGWIYQMGERFVPHPPAERLALDRGGIRVVPEEKEEIERLVAFLQTVAPEPYIYATPDAPEVYFLADKRNPTRTLFDFFEPAEGRSERILRMLDAHPVGAVVLNAGPQRFSELPDMELQRAIADRYPRILQIGRFHVRWAEDDEAAGAASDGNRSGRPASASARGAP